MATPAPALWPASEPNDIRPFLSPQFAKEAGGERKIRTAPANRNDGGRLRKKAAVGALLIACSARIAVYRAGVIPF